MQGTQAAAGAAEGAPGRAGTGAQEPDVPARPPAVAHAQQRRERAHEAAFVGHPSRRGRIRTNDVLRYAALLRMRNDAASRAG